MNEGVVRMRSKEICVKTFSKEQKNCGVKIECTGRMRSNKKTVVIRINGF